MIKLKKDMIRLSPYVIADLLQIITDRKLSDFKYGKSEFLMEKKTLSPYPSFIKVIYFLQIESILVLCCCYFMFFVAESDYL